MKIDNKITYKRLQFAINRKATKISALLTPKIDKYKYLSGEERIPSDQSRIIAQAKFLYSPLVKAFDKKIKTN